MKFVISSSSLLSTLSTASKVISSKNTLPILDYFLFDIKSDGLHVTASDLETTITTVVTPDSVESEGVIAAPVKLLIDSLKEFSEQPLTFEADETTWEIKISWTTGSITLPGMSGMSYPSVQPLTDTAREIEIEADTLLGGINKTIFATADDELRPVMNGIFIDITPAQYIFVATDAHKLVKYTVEKEGDDVAASFILPKKPANLLRTMLLREDDTVKVAFDDKNVKFSLSNSTLICRLIEGTYPNYNAVIPANNPNKVIVDRIELLNGIKRVAVCSNQATNLIKFEIGDNRINLTAQDLDFSYSANENLSCSYEGSPVTIGFKSTFLIEILSNLETPSVIIELADSTRSGVFKPLYDDVQPCDTLMILMPMLINA
ncbi:MAG TPA: DNA polymerase III subunit beta [Candidatus Tidjanibacter faecipullorum]|uniref:Beta sliding clamp n=1 Tax=Candidatus Tidjanibacter faecipullorum TaxID=2838766 RepID=A0A9D2DF78_9BACT|nr:DNA polymerase III subunit beta [Candidatus Tidjanibacter faecipullorum]